MASEIRQPDPEKMRQVVKAKLVQIHGLLGEYQDYISRHGVYPPKDGGPNEYEAVTIVLEYIEKRTNSL